VSSTARNLPGLDLARFEPWAAEHLPLSSTGGTLTARHIAGGKSNLTYEISDGVSAWVLRRPPLGHVLATAHDMAREYAVMSALHDTAVPVPATYVLCRDESVLGAPFYIMERMAGAAYRWARELAPLGRNRVRALSEHAVDVLAELHSVDPAAVGLEDFGRPEGFLSRQLGRWRKQLAASYSRDLPGAGELHRRLSSRVDDAERTGSSPGIVHGDFRLDNVLTASDPPSPDAPGTDRITAVIDWEMATLGDPLTDLALMLIYGRCAELPIGSVIGDAALAPGFLGEADIIARYGKASHRDLSHFGFYLGLATYKLAAILEGIHYRHIHRQTVGPGFEGVGDSVDVLLEAGLEALEQA
jgi:aminoglycoside phosphotransferase (APT) family kinase protein